MSLNLHRGAARTTAVLTPLLAALALIATPALASRPHEYTTTFGAPGSGAGQLKEPAGVAVNEATGDVYVVDKGNNRVEAFDAKGEHPFEFNGSGANANEGEAAPSGRFEAPTEIAVDNSCALHKLVGIACETSDPSNGDIYVVDAGHRVLDEYSATGKYLGQITEAGGIKLEEEGLEGVAVDPSGAVWVYTERPGIDQCTNSIPNECTAPEIQPSALGGFGVPGFAVDGEGNFYGILGVRFPPRAIKWDHTGKILNESLDGEGVTGVSADQISNDALVDKGTSIHVFSPEGKELEALGEENGEKHLVEGAGVGVNASAATLYVADAGTGTVVVFGSSQPSAPKVENPSLQGESFSNVDASSASVTAKIDPRSELGEAATEYHFQYGRCATPTTCASSGYETTLPGGRIPADFEVHTVSATLEGLQAHTAYHFRVLAENAKNPGDPVAGEEASFTTEGAGGELKLPDNRGWELVSPPDKRGARISPISESGVVQAAASGDGITYLANAPTEAEPQGYSNEVQVLSRRATASWSSSDIAIPHSSVTGKAVGEGPEYKFFDSELTSSAVQPFGEFIPALSAEASESSAYLHELGSCTSDCYRPLVTGKAGFANVPTGTVFGEEELCMPRAESAEPTTACGPRFLGATEDLSHIVLSANATLTPGAAPLGGLYEWTGGALSPVSVLPSKEAVGEATLGFENQAARQAISSDGTRIAWTRKEVLYERDMERGETVQLDAAQFPTGEGAEEQKAREESSGGGAFQFASADGSRVLFTDFHPLTGDSGAKSGQSDLYECRLVVEASKVRCELSDLTPKHGEESADVLGGNHGGAILGASEDATMVYFVAKGVLSEAANARGAKAQAGKPNLYLRRAGSTEFIATLAGNGDTEEEGDAHDWNEALRKQPTRVSKTGQWLEFMSEASLTGYDNADRTSGEPVAEVYLYDAASKRLACASCEPTGVRPVGIEYETLQPGNGGLAGGPRGTWQQKGLVAAIEPGWTAITSGAPLQARYQPRYLNNEGRLFFNSADSLVPADTNGIEDVYEHEPAGVGDCGESSPTYSATSEGCVSLISSGSSAEESAFMDASESGDDVFFLTSARLSALDTDAARDVYDAHVCSSAEPCISYSNSQSPPCTNEASCKASPTPQPSIFGAPSSATFAGMGNPKPAVAVKPKTAAQLRAEKLAKALKACRTKTNKKKRQVCEKQARARFGSKAKAKPKAKSKKKK